MIFKELAPWVLLLTLFITVYNVKKIKKTDISSIDGIFAICGLVFGLIITLLNMIYSNSYLITLGPILTLASLLYLIYVNKTSENISLNLNAKYEKIIVFRIIFWICLTILLISFNQSAPYYRPIILFISTSIAVASLGLEIFSSRHKSNMDVYRILSKIIALSIIFRFSAYFVSPYPIGSDTWIHAEIIKGIDITHYFPKTPEFYNEYYKNFPLMHIFSSTLCMLTNLNSKESISVVGIVLVFSTVFIYIIAKKITDNINIGLFSVLLINFSDFHIQWSIQIIAMTFGIAIYTILLYTILDENKHHLVMRRTFLLLFMYIIIWTHTISSFIFLVSLLALYLGNYIYMFLYEKANRYQRVTTVFTIILFSTILINHWIDPKYPFFEAVTKGLIDSLNIEAKFLGRTVISSEENALVSIYNIFGFLIFVFFGIIGCLRSLAEKNNKTKFSLVFMLMVLFFVFFVFPLIGMRNIMPYRWPAFIYITLTLFTAVGMIQFISIIGKTKYKAVTIFLLLLITSFFMITNSFTNIDSPIYSKSISQKMIWTQSEMELFTNINSSYDGIIIADVQTKSNLFQTYLKREKSADYQFTENRNLDINSQIHKLIIWRKSSIDRPVQIHGYRRSPELILGNEFKKYLDTSFYAIYDTGESKAYCC